MRLLHVSTLEFSDYISSNEAPPYIIASHRWLDGEVSYQEFLKHRHDQESEIWKKAGMAKILGFCSYIKSWRETGSEEIPQYLWIDTCCVNKESSAELQETITSMFQWYAEAWCCLARLNDVDLQAGPEEVVRNLRESVWFTRGWTLQELLAPATVIFLDNEWRPFGRKSTESGLRTPETDSSILDDRLGFPLQRVISEITGIPVSVLWDYKLAMYIKTEERISWSYKRTTTRVEDKAYCMLGICQVFMTVNYGEGANASRRLWRKIGKKLKEEKEAQDNAMALI